MTERRQDVLWGGLFVLVIGLTRYGSLHTEVIDWDESTFILMAQDVLRGHLPYTQLFDNKPPLMFLMLAGVMRVFGESVLAIRLFGAGCLWIAAIASYGVCRRWVSARAAGLATMAVIVGIDAQYFSQYTSVEIPAVACLMVSVWCVVARGDRLAAAGCAGLGLSLATLLRPNVATIVIAVGFLYAAGAVTRSLRLHRGAVIAYVFGGLLPVAAVIGLYAASGHLALFWLGAVTVPLSYAGDQLTMTDVAASLLHEVVDLIGGNPWFMVLAALSLSGVLESLRRITAFPRDATLIAVIALADLFSLVIGGVFQPHYLTMMMPFAAFPTAVLIARYRLIALASAGAVVLAAILPSPALWQPTPTPLQRAAAAIAADERPGETVWALRSHLILFYLDQTPVSPVVTHPSNLVRPSIVGPLAKAGYIHADELGFVMQSLPRYLVLDAWEGIPAYLNGADRARFAAFLQAHYQLWQRIEPVVIYKSR